MIAVAGLFAGGVRIETKPVDCAAGKTLIRCWHRLHVDQLKTHDFIPLIAPHVDDELRTFHAAVRHDEIKALAVLKKDRFVGVAYDVDGMPAACALVSALAQENVDMCDAGDRWKIEASFAKKSS
jgi:hypothetical protein